MHEHEQPVNDEQMMAVLLGEPSPPGPDGAEQHAAAERDMAVVREQLRWIGDGLARKAAAVAPDPQVSREGSHADSREPRTAVRRSSRPHKGLLALAASAAVVLGGTAAYLIAHNGAADDGGGDAKLTPEGVVACSTAVAEGTVVRVEQLTGDEKFRVVLDVDRHYKPESGKPRLSFTTEGAETRTYYRTGVRMLVVVSRFAAEGPETFREGDPADAGPGGTGKDPGDALAWGREWVKRALPGAEGLGCPVE